MQMHKKILVLLASFFAIIPVALASTVEVTADSTAEFTVGNCTIKRGSTATSFDVSGNTLTIILGVGDAFVVNCPSSIRLTSTPSVGETCESNGTKTYRQTSGVAGYATTFTAATTTAACGTVGNSTPGGGSSPGGGSGGSGSSGSSSSGDQPAATSPPSSSTPAIVVPAASQFVDVNRTRRLDTEEKTTVVENARTMVTNGTLAASRNLRAFSYANRDFAIRVVLGLISAQNCGTRATVSTCLAAAISNNILEEGNLPSVRITRAQYYKMLLTAGGIELIAEEDVAENLCSDVTARDPYARVVATAKFHNIAETFGTRCKANKRFKRYEALLYAERTLSAMAAN